MAGSRSVRDVPTCVAYNRPRQPVPRSAPSSLCARRALRASRNIFRTKWLAHVAHQQRAIVAELHRWGFVCLATKSGKRGVTRDLSTITALRETCCVPNRGARSESAPWRQLTGIGLGLSLEMPNSGRSRGSVSQMRTVGEDLTPVPCERGSKLGSKAETRQHFCALEPGCKKQLRGRAMVSSPERRLPG